jgi:hypothetical protein
MKSLFAFLFFGLTAGCTLAQTPFWIEGFGSGCNTEQLATAYSGPNGSWTVTNTGANAGTANLWYISGTETNTGVGNCGAECGANPNPTLHVSNQTVLGIPADIGAAYYEGLVGFCGFIPCAATDKRVESPTIDCSQYTDVSLEFTYLEGGNAIDNATVWYFDGSTWSQLDDPAKTFSGACSPQGQWTLRTLNLPASANENPNVKIGFRWVNNDDGDATDPSFAVDDITLSGVLIVVDPAPCLGDFNNDGIINSGDLLILLSNLGCSANCVADMNGDDYMDITDLLAFLTVYGTTCD